MQAVNRAAGASGVQDAILGRQDQRRSLHEVAHGKDASRHNGGPRDGVENWYVVAARGDERGDPYEDPSETDTA
jgi:hypothetical protein